MSHPSESQNAACVLLEKAGYKANKTRGEEVAKNLKTGPIYVFEQWFEGHVFRRILVGPLWVTVTRRQGVEPSQYSSYATKLYVDFAKAADV